MPIPTECERRFLVTGDGWRCSTCGAEPVRQGYLCARDGVTVRVRRIGTHGYITIKTPYQGITRAEMEYEIPADHADFLIETACRKQTVEKVRHRVPVEGMAWTVDVFLGLNKGLVLAEVELNRADQPLALPPWVGPEVTTAADFSNSSLSRHPFALWRDKRRFA